MIQSHRPPLKEHELAVILLVSIMQVKTFHQSCFHLLRESSAGHDILYNIANTFQ